jgi:hypothetical protein
MSDVDKNDIPPMHWPRAFDDRLADDDISRMSLLPSSIGGKRCKPGVDNFKKSSTYHSEVELLDPSVGAAATAEYELVNYRFVEKKHNKPIIVQTEQDLYKFIDNELFQGRYVDHETFLEYMDMVERVQASLCRIQTIDEETKDESGWYKFDDEIRCKVLGTSMPCDVYGGLQQCTDADLHEVDADAGHLLQGGYANYDTVFKYDNDDDEQDVVTEVSGDAMHQVYADAGYFIGDGPVEGYM